jgi:hypothetical protein
VFTLATPVTYVGLLLLFGFTTIQGTFAVMREQSVNQRVGTGFHLLMSVVMVAMVPSTVWRPLTSVVTGWVFVLAMAAGAAWFARQLFSATDRDHRLHLAGCTVMFLAMTWHLAAMEILMGSKRSMPADGPGADPQPSIPDMGSMSSGRPPMDHSGMDHTGMDQSGMGHAGMPGGATSTWAMVLAILGIALLSLLLIQAIADVVALTRPMPDGFCCGPDARTKLQYLVDLAADAAMCVGMVWMSLGLLSPLLPFVTALRG